MGRWGNPPEHRLGSRRASARLQTFFKISVQGRKEG